MKFSLILSTCDRTQDVRNFLESLDKQQHRDFELIIVDQNPDDRLGPIISNFKGRFPILHLRSEKGLSKARNVGLKHVTGDIVGFPDDDCEYPPHLLNSVKILFDENKEWDGITGCSVDKEGRHSAGKFSNQEGEINLFNFWNKYISFTIFLRKAVCQAIGDFDEDLGLGAKTIFLSGEETDYLIRALKGNFRLYYRPELKVFHPNPILLLNTKSFNRAYYYGCGWGRVLAKHQYPLWFKLFFLSRPVGGMLLSLGMLKFKKSYYHLNVFRGRLKGWQKSA